MGTITLHLEVGTIAELRLRLREILDETTPVFDHKHPDKGDFGQIDRPGDIITAPGEYTLAPQGEPVQRDKPRRAHRRVRPINSPVVPPVAAPEPDPDPLEHAFDVLAQPEPVEDDGVYLDVDEDAGIQIDVRNAVDNEMLKREVISSLADMFTAGNVKVVRHVLHKYGRGAKSFPEIDPVHFPEIKAALDRNEAA